MLSRRLAEIRASVHAIVPELSSLAFDNPPEVAGSWLSGVAAAAKARNDLFAGPADPAVETIYVEMNEFVLNTDLWVMDAFAFGPPALDGTVCFSEWFDALVGDWLGEMPGPGFRLTGMEAAQRWFEETERDARREASCLVEDFVELSFFALLDRVIAHADTDGFNLRLAARRHEAPTMCVWQPSGDGSFRLSLHDEGAPQPTSGASRGRDARARLDD